MDVRNHINSSMITVVPVSSYPKIYFLPRRGSVIVVHEIYLRIRGETLIRKGRKGAGGSSNERRGEIKRGRRKRARRERRMAKRR